MHCFCELVDRLICVKCTSSRDHCRRLSTSQTPSTSSVWTCAVRSQQSLRMPKYKQSQQWKRRINLWNIFKVKEKKTLKTPKWCHGRRSGAFVVYFKHISPLFLVFVMINCFCGMIDRRWLGGTIARAFRYLKPPTCREQYLNLHSRKHVISTPQLHTWS